nr:VaFE repeat-containing surface-anchored protein [Corynebacterium pygosceleis]
MFLALVLAVFGLSAPSGTGVASAADRNGQPTLTTPVKIDSQLIDKGYRFEVAETGDIRSVALFMVELPDGRIARAYCINAVIGSAEGAHNLSSFGEQGIPGGPHVRWVLKNSYPEIGARELAANAGVTGAFPEEAAITATQFALWHFTNPDVQRPRIVEVSEEIRMNVDTVADYLIDHATAETAPEANLVLAPTQQNGQAGSDIDGFTVTTTAESGRLTLTGAPAGVELIDPARNVAVGTTAEVTSGQRFAVRVPAGTEAGTATLTLEADVPLQAGSVLVYTGGVAQQLGLVSDTAPVRQEVRAAVSWTAEPAPEPEPTIGTLARDKADGDKTLDHTGGTVVDTVSYSGLTPGQTYTITGELIDADTERSTEITARHTFTPDAATGTVDVEFTVPAALAGRTLVVFEKLFTGSRVETGAVPVAVHEDLKDLNQTVTVAEKPVTDVPTPTDEPGAPGDGDDCGGDGHDVSSSGGDCGAGSALSAAGLLTPLIPAVVLAVLAGGASSAVGSVAPVTGSAHVPATVPTRAPVNGGSVTPVAPAPSSTVAPTPAEEAQVPAAEPRRLLANTGASVLLVVLAGLILLLLGASLVQVRRRRS